MDARWTFSLVACTAVLLGGALLATAAEPKTGPNQPAIQAPAGTIQLSALVGTTVLDPQGQKLGRIKNVLVDSQTGRATFVVLDAVASNSGHPLTYTAERPIDSPSMSPPPPPPSAVAAPSYVMPPPCYNYAAPSDGLTADQEGFYNE